VPLTRRHLPVARDEGLLVENVGDETVIYDDKTKEAHCLSPLAAVVFAHCNGRTSVERLATLAAERLDHSVEDADVMDALAQLEERELLAVPLRGGVSRRDMLRRSAAVTGGAALAPLITSVAAPPAIAAQTATCANLLCCPCCTVSKLNFPECCTIQNVTVNCQCTQGSRTLRIPGLNEACAQPIAPPNNCAKFCKPAGASAPPDAACSVLWTQQDAFTTCTGSGAGVCACNACAGCSG
jgi:hypothetical protein